MDWLSHDLADLRARLDAADPAELAGMTEALRALGATIDGIVGKPPPGSAHDPASDHIRALMSDAVGCVSEGFVLFDEAGRLVLCNDRYRDAYPLLADRLVPGVRFGDVLMAAVERGAAGPDPDDPDGWIAERLHRHIHADHPSDHRLGDGRWYRISEHATRSGGIVKILTDITELKRHEEALADSEARYRRLVEMAPYGIVVWDGARVRFVNRAAASILGTDDPNAMIRAPLVETGGEIGGEDGPPALRPLFDLLPVPDGSAAAPTPLEATVSHAGNDLREVEVGVHPFAVEEAPAWFLVLTDVTERKQAERALQQSQKMQAIGQLAGGIAHEFNNMLTAIGGFARMARRAPQDRPRVEQCLTEIVKATDRAAGLTAQLLSFGRPDRSDAAQPVRVATVLDDLRRFLGATLGERHRLEIDLRASGAVVVMDPALLHQALVNLVINARDAMPEGGTVTLAVEPVAPDAAFLHRHAELRPGPFIAITVGDTGSGIDSSVIDRVFEPFFTTKEPGAGTGLGLSLVYSIVTRAGGAVELVTEPGHGSVFTLYLPVEAEVAAEAGAGAEDGHAPDFLDLDEEEPEGLSMAATVLLVEDEDQVRDFIRMTLEDLGLRVVCATDGADALAAYDAQCGAFDLLVTDLVMPRLGGEALVRGLRQRNPDLPAVLMSGYPPEASALEELLADDRRVVFLRKPVGAEELAAKVHALLL